MLIAGALLDELLARAAASPGEEICGLLFGDGERIAAAVAARNVAERRADSFEVDPGVLIAALRAERNGGPHLLGPYHSHPNGQPVPSARDRAAAEPGRLWLILAAGEARLWRAGRDGFTPIPLVRG